MQHRSSHAPRVATPRDAPLLLKPEGLASSRTQPTIAAYAEHWLATEACRLRERTAANYASQLRRQVLPRFGEQRLSQLSEDDMLSLIRQLEAAGYTAWTIRTILTPLSRMLNHAIRHGAATTNPIARLERRERPRVWDREQRILNRVEIASLLEAASPRYRTMLATAIFTGLRQGELLALGRRRR